jgi:5S rRNA maturation endonuclease (ribonuclease M5)
MKKSTSFDQNKIKVVCDQLCDRIEDLLDHFGLEYKMNGKFVSMSCPIHGGDNDGALNLYHTGDSYRGNWKCRTHNCEQIFKASIIGFIRGIISHRDYHWTKDGDSACTFKDALDYATNFLNVSLKDIKVCKTQKEKNIFVNNSKILNEDNTNKIIGITRGTVRKSLIIPSPYFLNRGFSADILDKYDVGDCVAQNKEMSNRAVVPIYDMDHDLMIGCSGRSVYNKCDSCKSYHKDECPNDDNLWKFSKWRHSAGFKTQQCLYNFWYAKDYIKESGKVIIVESPGNVWKLEQNNIHNSVAIFGSSLSDRQKTILDMSGAMELIIITDNDDAGNKARQQIYDKCHRTYNIKNIKVSKNDIAELTNNEINLEIKRYL